VARLQSEQDADDAQKGINHDSRTTAAAGKSQREFSGRKHCKREAIVVIPSTRMEDSRPVGIQFPGETAALERRAVILLSRLLEQQEEEHQVLTTAVDQHRTA